MSYSSLATLATDGDFRERVAACAVEQQTQAGGDLTGLHPTAWADRHLWQIAASPGFAAAYESALAGEVERPGADPAVITDEQILAVVQPLTVAPESP